MADNAEKDKKDNSFMMKLATLIVDKRKGFYLIFIVLCIFCVLSMNRVKVNNDLTTYLPDTTETRRGLDLMDSEFTTYGSARILICNVTFDEAQKLADQVEEMDGVSMLDFDDTEDHYHDMEALLSVTFDEEADTEATQQHLDEVLDALSDYDVYYSSPYYKKDMENGSLSEESALELLTCLWIKTLTINKVRSQAHTLSSAGSPMYQNVTIGGQTTDKKDAVNELSFTVLKSVAQTRLTQPNLTVRYHANLNKKFFDECIEVMKLGFGMPALNNDEIIIPSFINWGVKEEDAYNYSAIGCVETAVPGKWGYRCTGMSYINFPRVLLCAMNNGVDLTSKKRFTKGYGYFTEMETYEDLLAAWDKTVREMTRYSVIVENAIDKASEKDVPDVLCSALTDDCIGRGKTIKEGGAVYDFISGLQVGIANMADSLAAIKKLVYEEKKITKQQLWDAILDNFQSPENKKIQEMLIEEAPKYGNDNDYVDNLVVEAYDSYLDEIKKYPNTRYQRGPIGGIRYGGTSSISANVGQGMGTIATPDGRNAFEPLAEGCSPAHNADKNGPTAIFKTVSKLPTEKITGGVLLNQKMTPQMLSTEENKQKLEMLIRTFFNRLHGYHVQYNIVSKETLIDAQKHPEKHKDLIVRVAGYSAFFNVLSKKTQDDIIGRTEQTL